jgi:hypothetical protein
MEADHEEATRKRSGEMSSMDAFQRKSAETYWNPQKDRYEREAHRSAGDYRASWPGSWAPPEVSFHHTSNFLSYPPPHPVLALSIIICAASMKLTIHKNDMQLLYLPCVSPTVLVTTPPVPETRCRSSRSKSNPYGEVCGGR